MSADAPWDGTQLTEAEFKNHLIALIQAARAADVHVAGGYPVHDPYSSTDLDVEISLVDSID